MRLVLSDGTERMVAPWGLTVVPRSDADGRPIDVLEAVLIERRTVPGAAKSP